MTPATSNTRRTLDQRRAGHAWQKIIAQATVNNGRREYGEKAKEYAREAKKLPMRIMAAGLGQALAFILAKAKDKKPSFERLHDDLTDWINIRIPTGQGESDDLLDRIVRSDSEFLRRATDELLAYLVWLNRFAEAEGLTEGEAS